MNGESTYKPNFTVVDDIELPEPNLEEKSNSQTKETTLPLEDNADLNPNEINLIYGERHKMRLFDPKGIYTFRHIKISNFQSFLHTLSICISLLLIVNFYRLLITGSHQFVSGLGKVNNLNLLDKLSMTFIAIYGFIKIKKVVSIKVTKFYTRYRLALCANAINFIVLNYFKLSILFLALQLLIIRVKYPNKRVDIAFDLIQNGVMADTLSIITWFISIIIVIKAFKYCSVGETK